MKTVYQCESPGCGKCYSTAAEAEECEAYLRGGPAIVEVGDIVLLRAGYGWLDGDPLWVSNPEVCIGGKPLPHKHRPLDLVFSGASLCIDKSRKCPYGDGNCFGPCCTMAFYYVVTHIDIEEHRVRYHVATLALEGDHVSYTYNVNHHQPKKVENPPEHVVRTSRRLIGKKGKYLL